VRKGVQSCGQEEFGATYRQDRVGLFRFCLVLTAFPPVGDVGLGFVSMAKVIAPALLRPVGVVPMLEDEAAMSATLSSGIGSEPSAASRPGLVRGTNIALFVSILVTSVGGTG